MRNILLLLVLATLGACASLPGAIVEPPKDAPFVSWPNQEWASEALATVRRESLATLPMADAKAFCPSGMSERNWVHLMAAVVAYESGFKPTTVYRESFGVDSSGLFQLTKKTDNPNYGCDFVDEKDVQDPIKNIRCAGKIIKKLVAQNGVITNASGTSWKGMARYWSVMRHSRKLPNVKAKLKPWCE